MHQINEKNSQDTLQEAKEPRSGMYYVIPSQVFEDPELEHTEIVFYALLTSLAGKNGYCFASDKYLAEKMRKSEEQIKRYFKKLEDLGYITRESKRIGVLWDRKIFINHNFKKSPPNDPCKGHTRPLEASHMTPEYIGLVSEVLVSEEIPPLTPPKKEGDGELLSFPPFVKLRKTEYEKLEAERGKKSLDQVIEEINDYQLSTGKKYKDYAATIRNWYRRRDLKPTGSSVFGSKPDKKQRDKDGNDLNVEYNGVF